MRLNLTGIPEEPKKYPNWVCWTVEERDGKPTKIPLNSKTGGNAQSNNPATWGTYEEAVRRYKECENGGIEGIGFMLSDGFSGTDLDHCRNADTGEILSWAKDIIINLKSYGEVTPSNKGVRVLTKGKLPPGRRVKGGLPSSDGGNKGKIEMYDSRRFFTVTGNHLEGTPVEIHQREEELRAVHSKIFGSGQEPKTDSKPGNSPSLSDAELLQKAMKAANGDRFRQLWEGDFSEYPSQSEADIALCFMLSFWTGRDAARIGRLFRQSGLMREKWDQKHFGDGRTYGQVTIQKAIEETTKVYAESQKNNGTEVTSYTTSLLHYHLTDAGNAECFKELFGDQYVFIPEKKTWLRFDGIRWSEDQQVLLKVLETVRLRGKQAMDELQDLESRKAIVKWSLSSESKMKLNAALSIAESMLSQSINSFDTDPWVLCCANGAVDLRTGNLITPTKKGWLYKSTNIPYDPEARCKRFFQFLVEVFNGDRHIIDFVQKAIGYSLTGLTVEQILFILYGTGANGKSIFLNLIGDLLGDYSITTPASTFKDTPYHDPIPNDIARMAGARFIKSIEVKEGTKLNEERIKALTGGDRITARFLHNEFFEFIPVGKFWIAANHKPVVRGSDEAIWRRIRLIPFEVFIPPEKRDPHLSEKLRAELPGILAWAVEGCLKWQAEGLKPVGKVKEWTDNYRAESDLIAQFLEEKTEKVPGGRTKAGDLYNAYKRWCEDHGEFVITGTKFGKRMEEKEFLKKKDGYVYYHGMELL